MPALIFFAACNGLWFTGCHKPDAKSEKLFTQNCSCERLRHAVDLYRLNPSRENKDAVNREDAALAERIQQMKDRAEVVGADAKAQLLFDIGGLESGRAADLQRFREPVVDVPVLAATKVSSKGKSPRANPAVLAYPIPAAAEQDVPVMRAIPVSDAAPARIAEQAAVIPDNVPVRRAVAVDSTSIATPTRTP